jgi:hypothetical protein
MPDQVLLAIRKAVSQVQSIYRQDQIEAVVLNSEDYNRLVQELGGKFPCDLFSIAITINDRLVWPGTLKVIGPEIHLTMEDIYNKCICRDR